MKKRVALSLLLVLGGGAAVAHGDGKAPPAVQHRMAVMEAAGGHFTASLLILKQEVPFAEDRLLHAQSLAALARITPRAFEANVQHADSESKPDVWSQPERWKEELTRFEQATAELASAAAGTDDAAYAKAFKAVGGSCKSCHDAFKD